MCIAKIRMSCSRVQTIRLLTDVPGNSNSVESIQAVDHAVLTDPEAEEETDNNIKLPYVDVAISKVADEESAVDTTKSADHTWRVAEARKGGT